jgi:hypothetical protein
MRSIRTLTSAAATAAMAGAAVAGTTDTAILTFGFTDLNLDYETSDGTTGTLSGTSQALSAGDVTDVPTDTTTRFGEGYADMGGEWDATFNFDVSNITSDSADSVGDFSIIDQDGDEIAGFIEGTWAFDAALNTLEFSGDLTNVQAFTGEGNGMFEGTDGTSFPIGDGPIGDGVEGALIELSFAPEGFFSESFEGFNANFSGVLVPAPAAAGLLAFGGLVGARRRR